MIQSFLGFLGRALLSLIFIFSAVHKILSWQEAQQTFVQALMDWKALLITSVKFPMLVPLLQQWIEFGLTHTSQVLALATAFEFLGGMLLFLGISARLGAFLLLCFIIPATGVFHHFWDFVGPQKQIEMVNFMRNLSIMGGLLFVLAWGKGNASYKKSPPSKETD